MNITREQREVGTSLLKVVVNEQDYGEAVEKMLREYKRKANIPGFRPGMVPMGVVRKMYGKGAVAEQAYKIASNSVFEYLQKEGIDYVGDVIPSEEQGDFDFENNTEHEFVFEYGAAPKYDVALTQKDKITYHKIKIDNFNITIILHQHSAIANFFNSAYVLIIKCVNNTFLFNKSLITRSYNNSFNFNAALGSSPTNGSSMIISFGLCSNALRSISS